MTSAVISSAILRFRDLNVPEGRTVGEHRALIETRRSVWWGWWAQLNERIADEAMRTLEAAARGGVDLYLADSGRKLLYRAHCVEIIWHHAGDRQLSPDSGSTPQYYIERPCLAWFRFDAIEETDPSLLQGLSYVSVPQLFDERDEPYSAFAGKQVSSLEELFLQRRTLWFVRPRERDDPIHEIRLLGADDQEPRDFAETFLESRSTRFLWLSDVHFSAEGHHAFPLEPAPSGQSVPLSEALLRALQDLGITELAGVLVSGDLTWKGDPREFELAEDMLRQVASGASIKNINQRIALVPGNHDIRFSATPDQPDAEVTVAPDQAKENFADFYRRLFRRHPNEFLSSGRKYLVGRSVPVELVLLNSSTLDQIPQPAGEHSALVRFQGQGYVGENQLRDAAKQMKWDEVDRPGTVLRVAVLHHHLVPVPHSEPARLGGNYSVVLDSGRLMEWIVRHRIDIVLHGHQHEPFVARLARPVSLTSPSAAWHEFHVVGMGSSGVAQAHLPPDVTNVFGIVDVGRGQVTVSLYTVDPDVPSRALWSVELPIT